MSDVVQQDVVTAPAADVSIRLHVYSILPLFSFFPGNDAHNMLLCCLFRKERENFITHKREESERRFLKNSSKKEICRQMKGKRTDMSDTDSVPIVVCKGGIRDSHNSLFLNQ